MELKEYKIKEIGKVVTGKTPSTFDRENFGSDFLFITPSELHDGYRIVDSEKKISLKGFNSIKSNTITGKSVLVGCIGWDMGNVGYTEETCATNQQINSICEFKSFCNPQYAYYWLSTKKDYLFSIASVTRTPLLSKSTFSEILIPLPKIEYQNKIANILSSIDSKILINKKINKELEDMFKEIYNFWFIQFDFPDIYGNPYKSSGGKMIYNDVLKCEIPDGWIIESLYNNSLCEIIKPGVIKFNKKEYLATANIIGTDFFEGDIIEYETRENRANMQPSMYSIWFAKMKNSIKHLFLNAEMKSIINNVILSTGFCGLQTTEINFEYLCSFISSPAFEIIKNTLSHGATQQAVSNEDLLQIPLIIPPEHILKNYHDKLNSIFSLYLKNMIENRRLKALRDELLPMLMNGQLRVN